MASARTIVKAKRLRRLGTDIMRAVAKAAERSRDLTLQQAELVRRALEPYISRCSGKLSGLATLMGVEQSGFNRFMNRKQGTSWTVATRAAAMLGRRVDELLQITPEDLDFPDITDELARAAARLALLDGVPRAQIESRYRDAPIKGLRGINLDDWHRKLSGGLDPETESPAHPRTDRPRALKRPRKG